MGVCHSNRVPTSAAKGKEEERNICRGLPQGPGELDVEVKTGCPEAAHEFVTRVAAKAALRHQVSGAAVNQGCVSKTCPLSLPADFGRSHPALLGRCWSLPATPAALSGQFTTKSIASGVMEEIVWARPSRWVSLLYPTPTSLFPRHCTREDERNGAGRREATQNSSRSSDDVSDSQEARSHHFSCCTGAKDMFAFRVSSEESMEKEAAFLRKQGLRVCRGTSVRRWDRVEYFSSGSQPTAITVLSMQSPPGSVSPLSCFVKASSSSSNTDDAGATSASGSTSESRRSSVERNSARSSHADSPGLSSSGKARGGPGASSFPEESLHCHWLTITNSIGNGGCTDCARPQSPPEEPSKPVPGVETTMCDACDLSYNSPPPCSSAPRRRATCAMQDGPLMQELSRESRASPRVAPTLPVFANVIVSCFDVSIDPSIWKECGYRRVAINFLEGTSSPAHRFGDGVVTSVMYGGMCALECSSEAAADRLRTALGATKWDASLSGRSLKAIVRKILRKKNRRGGGASAAGSDGTTNITASALESPSDHSYRVVRYVGGKGPCSELEGGQLRARSPSKDSTVNPSFTNGTLATSWIDVEDAALFVRGWAVHLLSHPKYSEPLATYVRRFQAILPFLRLVPSETLPSDLIQVSGDNEFCGGEEGIGAAMPSLQMSFSHAGTEGMHDNVITPHTHVNGSLVSAGVASAAHVDVGVGLQEPGAVRSGTRVWKVGLRLRWRANCAACACKNGGEKAGCKPCAYGGLSADGSSIIKDRLTVGGTSAKTFPSSLPASLPYNEEQVLWEHAMLELRAVNIELRELTEARQAAERKLAKLNSTLHDLRRLFLPHSSTGEVRRLCAYLTTALEEPAELPERCAFVGGRDWFPCLAALLWNPQNSLRCIEVMEPMVMSTLPQLGMVAGLLDHNNALKELQGLAVRCDQLHRWNARARAPASRRKDLWLQARAPPGGESGGKNTYISGRQCAYQPTSTISDCDFFLTPKQAHGIFLALTTAVLKNCSHHQGFTFSLKGFPVGRAEPEESKVRGFLNRLLHMRVGCEGAPTDKLWGSAASSSSPSRETSKASTRAGWTSLGRWPNESVSAAWREAERRPYCMILRHREEIPVANSSGYSPVSDREEREEEREKVTSHLTSEPRWVCGLTSDSLLAAVMEQAGLLLLDSAPRIFDELREACDRRNSRQVEGPATTRPWGKVVLTR